MTDRHLHIISFDVPFPADYGGVIDVFYKVKALHAIGIKIHLHCFHYGREESEELEAYCEEVFYYPRNMNRSLLIHPMPFIVISRQQDALLRNLLEDDYPILFEGKHTTYYIDHPDLEGRKKFIRTHNIEGDYYRGLGAIERNPLKKWYLKSEGKKLERHRPRLVGADHIFCISKSDLLEFDKLETSCSFVPPFHANDQPIFTADKEPYSLYHGNMGVKENEEAALFLIREVFNGMSEELRIFGKGSTKRLKSEVAKHKNVSLSSGSQTELELLVRAAQIQVLPTFQSTGMKLKLLYSLFNGGHVLVNPQMIAGTGTDELVVVAAEASDFQLAIRELMSKPFTANDFEKRKGVLADKFSNQEHAKALVNVIFNSEPRLPDRSLA